MFGLGSKAGFSEDSGFGDLFNMYDNLANAPVDETSFYDTVPRDENGNMIGTADEIHENYMNYIDENINIEYQGLGLDDNDGVHIQSEADSPRAPAPKRSSPRTITWEFQTAGKASYTNPSKKWVPYRMHPTRPSAWSPPK